MRRTKVVATVGPATQEEATIESILLAGVDVVRLNAAHQSIEQMEQSLATIRLVSQRLGKETGVLVDLPGPKIRVGEVADGSVLEPGAEFHLVGGQTFRGDATRASITFAGLWRDVRPGDRILIDDGRIELEVTGVAEGTVLTQVVIGGELLSHKGVNVPRVTLSVETISSTDERIATWASNAGIDWLGMSFVRRAEDIDRMRAIVGTETPILAKIEKHEATTCIAEIVRAADAVMVARGDLAVETSVEQVPVLQRLIVEQARLAGKPVVVATEMLDSMRVNPRPTRAEASDVAHAIFQRADAVMLSGETAVGRYPVRAVETMTEIAATAEESLQVIHAHGEAVGDDVQLAVSSAAADLAGDLGVAAIVTLSQTGATAAAVARWRPQTPIIAVTPHVRTARKLSLVWGVSTIRFPFAGDTAALLDSAVAHAVESGRVTSGDRVVVTAGLGSAIKGGTDLIHVRTA